MDAQMVTLSCRFSVRSAGKSTHILDFDKRDVWLRFADVGKFRNSLRQTEPVPLSGLGCRPSEVP